MSHKPRPNMGDVFGRWTLIKPITGTERARWLVRCSCGTERVIVENDLKRGHSKSCGCLKREILTIAVTKHGDRAGGGKKPRLYEIWSGMRKRCNDPNNPRFQHYGGRGIKVCAEWDDYEVFKIWALANGYEDNLTIERDNNNLGYGPSNCRWIPMADQAKNRRYNHLIPGYGVVKTLAEWTRDPRNLNLADQTIADRLAQGMSLEQAFSIPKRVNQYR